MDLLSMEQRQATAEQLRQLNEKLKPYAREVTRPTLVRDLPGELQKALRNTPAVGPITSSGIEHVYQIFNRLDVLRHAMINRSMQVSTAYKLVVQKPIKPKPTPSEPKEQMVSTNSSDHDTVIRFSKPTAHPPSSELDFGPFDPRRS